MVKSKLATQSGVFEYFVSHLVSPFRYRPQLFALHSGLRASDMVLFPMATKGASPVLVIVLPSLWHNMFKRLGQDYNIPKLRLIDASCCGHSICFGTWLLVAFCRKLCLFVLL
jgi:hypothetical protein